MTFENREADLVERFAEVARERGGAHVAGSNLKLFVEFLSRIFGQVILLPLLHLLVADEVLVQLRVHAR